MMSVEETGPALVSIGKNVLIDSTIPGPSRLATPMFWTTHGCGRGVFGRSRFRYRSRLE